MMKKIIISLLMLLLIFSFVGCGVSGLEDNTISEEDAITAVAEGFIQALSQEDWETAKNYCLPSSLMCEILDQLPTTYSEIDFQITNFTITKIEINSIFAEVECYFHMTMILDADTYSDDYIDTFSLEKVNEEWVIYDTGLTDYWSS